jgi:hypothetical protein
LSIQYCLLDPYGRIKVVDSCLWCPCGCILRAKEIVLTTAGIHVNSCLWCPCGCWWPRKLCWQPSVSAKIHCIADIRYNWLWYRNTRYRCILYLALLCHKSGICQMQWLWYPMHTTLILNTNHHCTYLSCITIQQMCN